MASLLSGILPTANSRTRIVKISALDGRGSSWSRISFCFTAQAMASLLSGILKTANSRTRIVKISALDGLRLSQQLNPTSAIFAAVEEREEGSIDPSSSFSDRPVRYCLAVLLAAMGFGRG